jgi:integrase
MKKREGHLVPLGRQALKLLRELRGMTGTRRWVFPNHRRIDEPMSDTSMNAAPRRLGHRNDFTAHGFLATASTELHELGYRTISLSSSSRTPSATRRRRATTKRNISTNGAG